MVYEPGFFERFFDQAAQRLNADGRIVLIFPTSMRLMQPHLPHPIETELERGRFMLDEKLQRRIKPPKELPSPHQGAGGIVGAGLGLSDTQLPYGVECLQLCHLSKGMAEKIAQSGPEKNIEAAFDFIMLNQSTLSSSDLRNLLSSLLSMSSLLALSALLDEGHSWQNRLEIVRMSRQEVLLLFPVLCVDQHSQRLVVVKQYLHSVLSADEERDWLEGHSDSRQSRWERERFSALQAQSSRNS